MINRRIALIGAGALMTAGLALSGCSSSSSTSGTPSGSSSTAAAASATDKLTTALTALKSQGYDFKITAGGGADTGTGTADFPNQSAALDIKGVESGVNLELGIESIKGAIYVKIDAGALGSQFGIDATKWYQIDLSKITDKSSMPLDLSSGDVLDLAGLLSSTTNITAADATHIKGTVNLTKATGAAISEFSDDSTSLPPGLSAVPFTVTLDDQGRVTDVNVNASAVDKTSSIDLQLSNYGSPSAINAPDPASVVPAPDTLYSLLNS